MPRTGYAPGWQVRCVSCGWIRAAADLGLVRIGAWSWKKAIVGRCGGCGRIRLLALERGPGTPAPRPAPGVSPPA